MSEYDSRPDTYEHIGKVRGYLSAAVANLLARADRHDASKLVPPEREAFDIATPKLAGLVYSSEPYKQSLRDLGVALEHHYSVNSHHPEHFENGVSGMSLLDLVEMLVDWKAASERMRKPMPAAPGRPVAPTYDSDFLRSIGLNQERFGYSDELRSILENTARELGLAQLPDAPSVAEEETELPIHDANADALDALELVALELVALTLAHYGDADNTKLSDVIPEHVWESLHSRDLLRTTRDQSGEGTTVTTAEGHDLLLRAIEGLAAGQP